VSDDAPQPSPAPQRGVREAVVHAGVVATALALGEVCVALVSSLVMTHFFINYGLVDLLGDLRGAAILGITAAVAAHRRPGCSWRRALLECAALALIAWQVTFALWVGSEVMAEVMGVGGPVTGRRTTVAQALDSYLQVLSMPRLYLFLVSLALGLFVAAGRRGTRSEGLALVAPSALVALDLTALLVRVPVVAVALPLLSRAADRYLARRAADI
jgi:hypothetical protein